jgi:Family of unknown function (DUF5455)
MPLLGLFLGAGLSGIVSFLAQFFVRKSAVALTAIASLSTITIALMYVMKSVVNPLLASAFTTSHGQAFGLAFPPVAGQCLTSIATMWAACAVFAWQYKAINLAVQA